ncbi:MAG: hypothetical protein IKK51_10825 [Oscillospiraceae bacterium]|nr:hypothetical protein [Oscillospiraceae bacterium]
MQILRKKTFSANEAAAWECSGFVLLEPLAIRAEGQFLYGQFSSHAAAIASRNAAVFFIFIVNPPEFRDSSSCALDSLLFTFLTDALSDDAISIT